jgi:hypothetical protein
MSSFHPIVNFQPTTITKAFLLNALVTTLITVFAIYIKNVIEEEYSTKIYSEKQRILLHITVTFLVSVALFMLFRFLLGFGGGMIMTGPYKTFF